MMARSTLSASPSSSSPEYIISGTHHWEPGDIDQVLKTIRRVVERVKERGGIISTTDEPGVCRWTMYAAMDVGVPCNIYCRFGIPLYIPIEASYKMQYDHWVSELPVKVDGVLARKNDLARDTHLVKWIDAKVVLIWDRKSKDIANMVKLAQEHKRELHIMDKEGRFVNFQSFSR